MENVYLFSVVLARGQSPSFSSWQSRWDLSACNMAPAGPQNETTDAESRKTAAHEERT